MPQTYEGMTCEQWWERVSAADDGEADTQEQGAVADHLVTCADCRSMRHSSTIVRLPALAPLGSLSEGLAVEASTPTERRWLRARSSRLSLLVVGSLIVGVALPKYFQGDTQAVAGHVGRHLATWQLGFGVGLIVAALLSRFSHALLALATAVAASTVVTAVVDVALGHRAPLAELVHLVELVGVGLLWWVTPPHLRPRRRRGVLRTRRARLWVVRGVDRGPVSS